MHVKHLGFAVHSENTAEVWLVCANCMHLLTGNGVGWQNLFRMHSHMWLHGGLSALDACLSATTPLVAPFSAQDASMH